MDDDPPDQDRRFWQLPDDEAEQAHILEWLPKLDPMMKVYRLSPPHGKVIELHNVVASVVARLLDCGAIETNG